ncbi:MAG: DJ-1/PfpI family protein [Clostridia bacterium]|nr:DJ-1/PfpI family protein [Clostridia bacterium]
MVYVYLAEGFEEIEALAPVDILRRCGVEVRTVGVTGKTVAGAHGICVEADILPEAVSLEDAQMLILPGGIPGTPNLEKDARVTEAVKNAHAQGKYIAAICAAPSVFGHLGLLKGKTATCYPGFETELYGAQPVEDGVVCDGNIITAKGAGRASDFGFLLAGLLVGGEKALEIRKAMQYAEAEEN